MSLLRNLLQLPHRAARKKEKARLLKHFPKGAAADDTFIVGFPKSGNTWLAFLIGNTNLLLNKLPIQVTWWNLNDYVTTIDPVYELPEAKLPLPGGRFIATHSEYHIHYRKVVYLVRDPRDVLASYFDMALKHGWVNDSMDQFLQHPEFGAQAWKRHVEGWLNRKGLLKIHFIRYEDMQTNLRGTLDRLYRFFGLNVDPEIFKVAIERSSFENMSKAEKEYKQWSFEPKSFTHVRHGKANSFHQELTVEQVAYIEQECGPLMEQFGYESTTSKSEGPLEASFAKTDTINSNSMT